MIHSLKLSKYARMTIVSSVLMVSLVVVVRAQTTIIDSSTGYSNTSYTAMASAASVSASTACTNLPATLRLGSTDRTTSGAVTLLQKYLVAKNYLGATPNGNFGAATEAAVKRLQTANKISVTGEAGPQTRAAIARASCTTASATGSTAAVVQATGSVPPGTVITPTPTVSATPQATVLPSQLTVISPHAGESISIGSTYLVQWKVQSGAVSDVLIEDSTGLTVGYAASSISGGQYSWQVGNYFTPARSDTQILSPGSYRIHIRNMSWSTSSADQYSAYFTITSAALKIDQIIPAMAPADGKTSVILYGSGFSKLTSVYIDGLDGWRLDPAFRSLDGKIMIFSLPMNLSMTVHTIQAEDVYPSMATGTPSNIVNMTVIGTPSN